MYGYDPAETLQPGSGGVAERVLGGEAAMWSEHLRPAILDYVVWPRAAAVAERLWSPAEDTKVGYVCLRWWWVGRRVGEVVGDGCREAWAEKGSRK